MTLRQIILAEADPRLSAAVREGVLAAITNTAGPERNPIASAIEIAASQPDTLGSTETRLLIEWLTALDRAKGTSA